MGEGVSKDSFGTRGGCGWGRRPTRSSGSLPIAGASRLPFSLKVLLENLLRTEDGANITEAHIRALAGLGPGRPSRTPRSSSPRPA